MYPEISEALRFPLLTQSGREFLYRMRQHPQAPLWNWPNGEQLDRLGLERVLAFAKSLQTQTSYRSRETPDWIDDFADRCLCEVPFYRQRSRRGAAFVTLPTCQRSDLAACTWAFVPDPEPLEQLIVFSSSGTTGYPTRTPHHPSSAACGVPLLEYALNTLHQVEFLRGPDKVAMTNVAAYPKAFTTAIVVAYLEEAGCVRVNLDPSAWRENSDRERYINAWKAPIWLGDPVALGVLEQLPLDHKPQAILSSIMHLSDAYAEQLSQRYHCPVLDIYAMTEAGIIAVKTPPGHRILPHDIHVEILDEQDQVCPEGTRGEIALTGGRNPYLPLLRYRTGDFASMELIDGHRVLVDLEGRQTTQYRNACGRVIHSMEITRLMRGYPVRRYQVSQQDRAVCVEIEGRIDEGAFLEESRILFGEPLQLVVRG